MRGSFGLRDWSLGFKILTEFFVSICGFTTWCLKPKPVIVVSIFFSSITARQPCIIPK